MTMAISSVHEAEQFMNPELKAEFKKMQEETDAHRKGSLLYCHKIGARFSKLEAGVTKYGEDAVGKVAVALDLSKSTVHRMVAFSTQYTLKEIQEYADRKMANGKPITWTHFVELMPITDADKRKKVIEQIFSKSLTIEKLNKLLDGASGAGGAGAAPSTPAGGISQIKSFGVRFNEKLSKMFDDVVLTPLENDPLSHGADISIKLDETVEVLEQLKTLVAERVDRILETKRLILAETAKARTKQEVKDEKANGKAQTTGADSTSDEEDEEASETPSSKGKFKSKGKAGDTRTRRPVSA